MPPGGTDQDGLRVLARYGVRETVIRSLYMAGHSDMGDVILAAQRHRGGHDDLRSLPGIGQGVRVLLAAVTEWRLRERRELFVQSECNTAFEQWQQLTGLTRQSEEWGEVWQVLGDSGLLHADRMPEPGLFGDANGGDGQPEPTELRRLRLAIVGGAGYWRDTPDHYDLPTCTALAAALADVFREDINGLPFDHAVTWLRHALVERVRFIADSPGAALGVLLTGAFLNAPPQFGQQQFAMHYGELLVILREAASHDEFAIQAFGALSRRHGVALWALCTGEWVVYSTSDVNVSSGGGEGLT